MRALGAARGRRRRGLARLPDDAARSSGSANEAFCIDSPVFPDELEVLPAIAEQAGFPVVGLLATHADWDHLLGRYAFPEAPLGVAETTSARLVGSTRARRSASCASSTRSSTSSARRRCRCRAPQALPVPGHCGIGETELELHPADGHTKDGMAIWIPWARVLVCGDYLSPLEIPMLSATGSASAYLATLDRLEPLVEQAEHVVPGHGGPIDATRAAAILREDRAYLRGADRARRRGEAAARPPVERAAPGARGERGPHRGVSDGSPLHRADPELARAILEVAMRAAGADPPPLGEVADAGRGGRARGGVDHARGARRPRGAGPVHRRADAAHDGDRPPSLLRLHPDRADPRVGADRRADGHDLRGLVAGGRGRGARGERGAALARRPGGLPGRAPAAASSRAAPTATCPRCTPRAITRPGRYVVVQRRGALLRALVGGDHGRRGARSGDGPRRPAARRRGARRRSTEECSPSSPPPARRTSGCSTTSPGSPPPAARRACGCTSTAPTARRRCARPARASGSRASRAPTR